MKKKPLSPEQKEDSARLKAIFNAKKKSLGLTQESVALEIGVVQSAVNQILNGVNALNASTAAAFSRILQEPISAFSPSLANEIAALSQGVVVNIDDVEYIGKVKAGLVRVIGEAVLGVDGDIEMIESPMGWLKIYSDDPEAYGLRVKGDSMYPRIVHGEFVLVEPNAKLHAGDDVMVRTKDGHNMIKRLGYFRDGEYQFLSINQDHRPITLDAIDVEHVHPVMGILKAHRYVDDSEPQ